MNLVFDLDGVLVDSREANLRAWRAAGVEPPSDFYYRTWESFASHEQHDRKCAEFETYANLIRPLPLLATAIATGGLVLSLCSQESLEVLRRSVKPMQHLHEVRCSVRDKITILAAMHGPGVYFDDNLEICERLRRKLPSWQIVHVLSS